MTVILVLLMYATVGLAVCGVLIGPPWHQRDRLIGWLVACLGMALFSLMAMLTASVLHMHPPLWLGLLVLVGFDAAVSWVLILLVRARRRVDSKLED